MTGSSKMGPFVSRMLRLDTDVLLRLSAGDTRRTLIRLARVVSRTGDAQAYLLLPVPVLLLDPGGSLGLLLALLVAFALERPLQIGLKRGLRRTRPCDHLPGVRAHEPPPDRFSFPSGHTSAAFVVCVVLSAFYPVFAVLLVPWAGSVGVSRVVLGVHYPSDVLAGGALGAGAGWLALALVGA